jgi:hypothetical protein
LDCVAPRTGAGRGFMISGISLLYRRCSVVTAPEPTPSGVCQRSRRIWAMAICVIPTGTCTKTPRS